MITCLDRNDLVPANAQPVGNRPLVKTQGFTARAKQLPDRQPIAGIGHVAQVEATLFRLTNRRHLHHDTHRDQPLTTNGPCCCQPVQRINDPYTTQGIRRDDTQVTVK
jgi:hypothetical protein